MIIGREGDALSPPQSRIRRHCPLHINSHTPPDLGSADLDWAEGGAETLCDCCGMITTSSCSAAAAPAPQDSDSLPRAVKAHFPQQPPGEATPPAHGCSHQPARARASQPAGRGGGRRGSAVCGETSRAQRASARSGGSGGSHPPERSQVRTCRRLRAVTSRWQAESAGCCCCCCCCPPRRRRHRRRRRPRPPCRMRAPAAAESGARWSGAAPIGAPCTQCLRHGDPMNGARWPGDGSTSVRCSGKRHSNVRGAAAAASPSTSSASPPPPPPSCAAALQP
jgi:hypothetical protein